MGLLRTFQLALHLALGLLQVTEPLAANGMLALRLLPARQGLGQVAVSGLQRLQLGPQCTLTPFPVGRIQLIPVITPHPLQQTLPAGYLVHRRARRCHFSLQVANTALQTRSLAIEQRQPRGIGKPQTPAPAIIHPRLVLFLEAAVFTLHETFAGGRKRRGVQHLGAIYTVQVMPAQVLLEPVAVGVLTPDQLAQKTVVPERRRRS